MTFSEAAMIMMSGTGTQPQQNNSYLEYVSKSKWSKQMVTIPINDVYHYTINIVLFDDASSFQYNLKTEKEYQNAPVVTSSNADPPEYDLAT